MGRGKLDPGYMIIKKWINEDDREKLFEHTRKLRELQKKKSKSTNNFATNTDDAASSPQQDRQKDVITLKDHISRTLIFPFSMCNTWAGISELITEAFRGDTSFHPGIPNGHYDLFTAKGETILPAVWHAIIQPGATITMRMRPIPDEQATVEDPAFKPPIHVPHALNTISEEHSGPNKETANVQVNEDDRQKGHSTTTCADVSNSEVNRAVDGLLRKYTTKP
ncbi:MAG: hypothetical protein Q9168_002060 [Polycauliona sp. 1 TL-2023]